VAESGYNRISSTSLDSVPSFLHSSAAVFLRPRRSTAYVDVAYCYRPSSVVCRSVCHTSEPCKNGCTDRDAFWVEDSGGPKEPCIRWGFRSPMARGKFEGHPIVKHRDTLRSSVQKWLNLTRCCLGCGLASTVGVMC